MITDIIEGNEKIGVTVPRQIVQGLDEQCGDVPRSKFIYRALEAFLEAGKKT